MYARYFQGFNQYLTVFLRMVMGNGAGGVTFDTQKMHLMCAVRLNKANYCKRIVFRPRVRFE